MNQQLSLFARALLDSVRDLLPIVVVISFFQIVVIKQPIPNLANMLSGIGLVVLGLTFFIRGLKMGLFPIGQNLAYDFARRGSLFWLLTFGFALGFGATIAEPALIAVAGKAAVAAADADAIDNSTAALKSYALGIRLTVAIAVGFSLIIGIFRILKGWPIQHLIIVGYLGVLILTTIAPQNIIGIAYDIGGVTTSTITVPLVAALGIGLASSIKGRNPMIEGFGLIAFASLLPIIFVLAYGIIF